MNPILKMGLGLVCLLLGPIIIVVSATSIIDIIGVLVVLIGLWLLSSSIIGDVRRSPRR